MIEDSGSISDFKTSDFKADIKGDISALLSARDGTSIHHMVTRIN